VRVTFLNLDPLWCDFGIGFSTLNKYVKIIQEVTNKHTHTHIYVPFKVIEIVMMTKAEQQRKKLKKKNRKYKTYEGIYG